MMPMSVSYHLSLFTQRNNYFSLSGYTAQEGFTLLEMLVVMTLVGLLAATVVPSLFKTVERRQVAAERQLLIASIERLGYRSYLDGQERKLLSSSHDNVVDYPFEVPAGWQLAVDQPINYSANGICGGGRLRLIEPDGSSQRYLLKSPTCKLTITEDSVEASQP